MQTQIIHCRCCDQPMDMIYQDGLLPGRDGHMLVTCWNENCAMRTFTFATTSYPFIDLSLYQARDSGLAPLRDELNAAARAVCQLRDYPSARKAALQTLRKTRAALLAVGITPEEINALEAEAV